MRAIIVENIDFQRGKGSKEALEIGMISKINQIDLANVNQVLMDSNDISQMGMEQMMNYAVEEMNLEGEDLTKLAYLLGLYIDDKLTFGESFETKFNRLDGIEKYIEENKGDFDYVYNASDDEQYVDTIFSKVKFPNAEGIY